MSAPLADRWRLTLPLAIPSLGGLAYLAAFDAPARLIALNAAALAMGALWVLCGRMPDSSTRRLALAGLAALALNLPVILGPEVGGVSRWLPAGPVMLQSGPLLLPLIVVLAAREPARIGAGLLVLAGAGLVLQPDAAGLGALTAASAALAWSQRSVSFALVAAGAAVLAVLTFDTGRLEPQTFTEHVLPHIAGHSVMQATSLGILLFVAAPGLLVSHPGIARAQGWSLASLMAGLGAMAVLGPFPYPLIGYGAAPILGLAFALGALARPAQDALREAVDGPQ